jgi:nucleoid-associated protein EbfC
MGTGFAKQKKQAKHLQQQMMQLQQTVASKMSGLEIVGEAGAGLVKITLSGNGEMKKIQINPECVDKDDIEGLEALIKAAHASAFKEVQSLAESSSSMSGMPDLSMLGM